MLVQSVKINKRQIQKRFISWLLSYDGKMKIIGGLSLFKLYYENRHIVKHNNNFVKTAQKSGNAESDASAFLYDFSALFIRRHIDAAEGAFELCLGEKVRALVKL